jgi:diguanylate cyclase (GGDEF)-like protein
MRKDPPKTLELYSREVFQVLLEYEINRSRRYPNSLSLLNIFLKVDPNSAEALSAADKVMMDILNANLRGADIPSKTGNEYLILLPTTDENGSRVVAERLLGLLKRTFQTPGSKLFTITAYIGVSCLDGAGISASMLMAHAARALSHSRSQSISTYTIFKDES